MSTIKKEPDWQSIEGTGQPAEAAPLTDAQVVSAAYQGQRGDQQRAIAVAGLELVALLLRKNQDYGSSVFDAPMLLPNVSANLAIRVRLSDKIKRIIQLAGNPAEVASESLDDTLDDVAGYRIIERAMEVMTRRP